MNKIFISTILMFILLPSVLAATNGLSFTEVKVKIDGDNEDVSEGETIDIDFKDLDLLNADLPIKLTIEVTNTLSNLDINEMDVDIDVTIKDLDENDDEEFDDDIDDLEGGDDDRVSFDFDFPLDAGDDIYDVKIVATGKQKNGTVHKSNFSFKFEVDKPKHKLIFPKLGLSRAAINCGESTDLNINVLNVGEEDEDEVDLEVTNEELGLRQKASFSLDSGDFDEDMRASRNFRITTDSETRPGVYPINIRLTYDEGDETETTRTDLIVNDCKLPEPTPEPVQPEPVQITPVQKEPEPTEVVVTQPVTQSNNLLQNQLQPPITGTQVTGIPLENNQESFFEENGLLLVILLYVVVVIVAGIVLTVVFRKRREY